MQKRTTIYSIEYWIKKGFSEKDAIEKINTIKRENSCWCKEYWVKRGLSEEEAINKLKEKQRQNAAKVDNKHKANPYDTQTWIKRGLTEEEAKNKIQEIKDSQNIYKKFEKERLNKVIEKRKNTYYNKSKEKRKKINKSRGKSKEQYIKEFGKEKAEKLLKERGKGRKNPFFRRYSKISTKFFSELKEKSNKEIIYGDNEKWIRYNSNKGFYVDCLYNNKIIEFNGDFYHANPKLYESDSIIKISNTKIKTALEIWKADEFKIKTLKKLGYDILIIWELDIVKNKEKTLNKCIKFLENE